MSYPNGPAIISRWTISIANGNRYPSRKQDQEAVGFYPPHYLLNKMIEISKTLSKDFPHVRVDFYIENNNLLLGELTFFTTGGYGPLSPAKYDTIFGSYLTLPYKQ